MNSPLQPELRPTPPWLSRLLLLAGLIVVMQVLGLISQLRHRPAELLLSAGKPLATARALERRFATARTRIWLMMYVIRCEDDAAPDDPVMALLEALVAAHRRGVDVRVCLDLGRTRETGEIENKHTNAQAWLEQRGIRVVLDEDSITTHAKVALIDDRWVLLGSHNWTRSALTTNREASVVLDDRGMVQHLETQLFAGIPGWE